MADATLTAVVKNPDGSLTLTGTNFTSTTTTVEIDGTSVPFTYVSSTELTVDAEDVPEGAGEVTVAKGGVEASLPLAGEGGAPGGPSVEPAAITAGTWPTPIDGFRAAVAGQQLVGLIPVGDEKTPYPTGTPQAPGSKFWMQNGYYKSATPT